MSARFSHSLREAGRLLRRRFATFALAVLLSASALALPLLALTIGYGVAPLAGRIPVAPEISVFAALSATDQEVKALKASLEKAPNVQSVQWITRDQALAELTRRAAETNLGEIKPNPLPDTLVVTFSPRIAPDELERTAAEFRKLGRVDGVHVDASWFRKATGLGRVAMRVAAFVGILTVVLLALVVVGAVRLVAASDLDELRLMRLIGADDRQIARPYAYAGGVTLLAAAALAVGAVAALVQTVGPDLRWLEQVLEVQINLDILPWPALAALGAAAFLAGLVGGSIGLRVALRRI